MSVRLVARCGRWVARTARWAVRGVAAGTLVLGVVAISSGVASATNVTAVSFASPSDLGNAAVTWTVSFTATTALAGGNTVTIDYPTNFAVSSSPTVTLGGSFASCAGSTATSTSGQVVVTLASGCSLAASATGSIAFSVTNPPAPQSFTLSQYTVATTTDATAEAASSAPLTITPSGSSVSSVSVNSGSAKANTSTTWTFAFTSSTSGALEPGDAVSLYLPSSITVAASPVVTLATGFSCAGTTVTGTYASGSPSTVKVTVPSGCSLADSTAATVSFTATNPPATTSLTASSFAALTTEDATLTPAGSAPTSFSATGSLVTAVSATGGTNVANAATTWTFAFTSSAAGALEPGDAVTLSLPSSITVGASPAVTLATGFSCAGTPVTGTYTFGTPSTLVVTIPSSCSLADSTAATLSFPATNPPSTVVVAASQFSVETSEDASGSVGASSVTPQNFIASGTHVSAVTFSPSPNLGDFTSTWTVGFTSSATGALAPQDTISITFPADVTLNAANADVLSSSFGGSCLNPLSVFVSGQTLSVFLGANCSLADSTPATLSIHDIRNPPNGTTDTAADYTVSTSEDPTTVSPSSAPTFVPSGTAVSAVAVSPQSDLSGASTTWTDTFTTSSRGALFPGDRVTLDLPTSLGVSATPSVTFGGGFTGCAAGETGTYDATTGVLSVSVPSGCTIAASTSGSIAFAGTNPLGSQTLAATSFATFTSEDPTAVHPATGVAIVVPPPPSSGGSGSGTTAQATLSVSVTVGETVVGNSIDLSTTGGSGTGAVTFSVVGGTAPGCSISGTVLTATGPGTCVVEATRAGDTTYASATSLPVTITFLAARAVPPPVVVVPHAIVIGFAGGSAALSVATRHQLIELIHQLHPGATITIYAYGVPRALALARAIAARRFLTHYRHLRVRFVLIVRAISRVRVVTLHQ